MGKEAASAYENPPSLMKVDAEVGVQQPKGTSTTKGCGGQPKIDGTSQGVPAASSSPPMEVLGVLRETEASVNASLAIQVESLSAFLSKVEALVAKGEMACTMLQVGMECKLSW